MDKRTKTTLIELTSLPTASGREDRVIAWVEAWRRKRPTVQLRRDRFGNMMLLRAGARSRRPIVLSAHLDHPAFVVCSVADARVVAELRGGVDEQFLVGSSVRVHHDNSGGQVGRIVEWHPSQDKAAFPRVTITFDKDVRAEPGDVVTWDIPDARIAGDLLHAPAIDDLAGVAAALTVFEQVALNPKAGADVRVLLTRAEEVGLIGASAACGSGILPKASRIIVLENAKALPEAPVGGGPIVRVGDRASVFDRELTDRLAAIAGDLAEQDRGFRWQRRLMSGGVCETTAFLAHGYQSGCVCLATLHAHNMNLSTGKIDAEQISVSDYACQLRLLVSACARLDEPGIVGRYDHRVRQMLKARRSILTG